MIKIGITGGIGSGKSIVSKAFTLFNVPTYNADQRAKAIIRNEESVKTDIKSLLGKKAYFENGNYNASFVSEIVFSDVEKLNKLNEIVHPAVRKDAARWFKENEEADYVIYEAAIMSAAKNGNELDYVITVLADEMTRIDRILKRDPHREVADIELIMAKQSTPEAFAEIADFIVRNNDEDLILEQVLALHCKFLTL